MLKVLLQMLDTADAAWKNGHLTRHEAKMLVKEIDIFIDLYELEQQMTPLN
jgi:hypothetical protein